MSEHRSMLTSVAALVALRSLEAIPIVPAPDLEIVAEVKSPPLVPPPIYNPSRYMPHQGKREIARRLKRGECK